MQQNGLQRTRESACAPVSRREPAARTVPENCINNLFIDKVIFLLAPPDAIAGSRADWSRNGMIHRNRSSGIRCCVAVYRLAGMLDCRDGKPLGPQSLAHFRDRCPVRAPHASGRSAPFEPARGLRPHQGAGGGIRRDPVRALVVRDVPHAVRPPSSRGVRTDHRRRRHLKHSAQALRGEPTGKLRLGTVLVPSVLRVGDLMVMARDRYPQIELELVQIMSSDGLARVRSGTLDASFYFGAEPEPTLPRQIARIVYHVSMPLAWAAELEMRRGRPSPGARGSSHPSRARIDGS